MQIIPTILEKEFSKVEVKLEKIYGLAKWLQIDVIDGVFSYGKTFDLELLSGNKSDIYNMLIEIHLMVKEPIKWLQKCLFVGATRVIGQVEMMNNRTDFIDKAQEIGLEVGLAFDIDTDIGIIPEETDVILLMARKAGFEPLSFDEKIWKKIEEVKKIREKNNLKFKIGIDGGIDFKNLEKLKKVGIDIAYCGGLVFNGNIRENLEKINEKNN